MPEPRSTARKRCFQNFHNFNHNCNYLQSVVDTVTSTLPYVGKKIKEAFLLIVEGFQNMIDAPVQAFAIMKRGASQ